LSAAAPRKLLSATRPEDSARALQARHGPPDDRPGLRKDYGDSYYAAFIIDPEGYRLEAFCDRAD